MASKKGMGTEKTILIAAGAGAMALVVFHIYRQRSTRQAARARAIRRVMLAQRLRR